MLAALGHTAANDLNGLGFASDDIRRLVLSEAGVSWSYTVVRNASCTATPAADLVVFFGRSCASADSGEYTAPELLLQIRALPAASGEDSRSTIKQQLADQQRVYSKTNMFVCTG